MIGYIDEIKESLARLEHEQWVHWMKYMYSLCSQDKHGNYIIPKEKAERQLKQINTKYKDLSEEEKQSDKDWAEKTLRRINLIKLLKEENKFER